MVGPTVLLSLPSLSRSERYAAPGTDAELAARRGATDALLPEDNRLGLAGSPKLRR